MRQIALIAAVLCACLSSTVYAQVDAKTRSFLRDYRHGFCPYPLPFETSLDEIKSIADHGFSAMGIMFAAPYSEGVIDWTTLDKAVDMIAADGRKSVLHICPRFAESEGLFDVMSNGKRIPHANNKSPNYSVLDIYDPVQKFKFYSYLTRAAERYANNPNVIGFVFGWGYMGETGFYIGDFLSDYNLFGSECAGYSDKAMLEYNRWRKAHGKDAIDKLPLPSVKEQSDDYIDWTHFKYWYVSEVFERGAVDAFKAKTDKPVGTFAYLPSGVDSYARAWCYVPNADFFRSAGAAPSFDPTRTLQDSGIGWEDAWQHDGNWDFTAKRMMSDEARFIAKGSMFHCMYYRGYKTEPQWEKDVYKKVSNFLTTENIRDQILPEKLKVALYRPTWGCAALPARSEKQLFAPVEGPMNYLTKMLGLVESFGLPYKQIVEEDLLEPERLSKYDLIILPISDYLPKILGKKRAQELAKDSRVLLIPSRTQPVPRSEFRKMLQKKHAPMSFDYDGDQCVAGKANNVIFNWTADPIKIKVLQSGSWQEKNLEADDYQVLK